MDRLSFGGKLLTHLGPSILKQRKKEKSVLTPWIELSRSKASLPPQALVCKHRALGAVGCHLATVRVSQPENDTGKAKRRGKKKLGPRWHLSPTELHTHEAK